MKAFREGDKSRCRRDRFVVKKVDDDGGAGVWIGCKCSHRLFAKVLDNVRNEPEKFIMQDFEHLSVMENKIVDLRIHAHVDGEKIILSNNPWGRANWLKSDGKVNLSSNGFTSSVLVLKSPS